MGKTPTGHLNTSDAVHQVNISHLKCNQETDWMYLPQNISCSHWGRLGCFHPVNQAIKSVTKTFGKSDLPNDDQHEHPLHNLSGESEWLHFHSTRVALFHFGHRPPLYPLRATLNMLMPIICGFVLFYICVCAFNSLSAQSYRPSWRAGSIAVGHEGLARSFNSSRFDYFWEDFSSDR